VFMLSVINRLLVRRLLRSALISEQLCHVHLPSDLCQQACCEPTTHRSVLKGSSPPQHYPHECQPEPPLSTPVGGGSSPPCPSGAWLASDDRGRQSASATPVFPAFCEVSRMATGTRWRLRPAEETQPTTASTSPTGVTSATNRSDAPAV